MPLPQRNYLKSIRYWLKRICAWIAVKRPEYVIWLDEDQVAIIDALVVACEATVALIDTVYPPT